jgi:ABC-type glycerol-3-phosphate transport system permease component
MQIKTSNLAKKRKILNLLGSIFVYSMLLLGVSAILFPLLWAFSSSLKANNEIFVIPMQWIPKKLHWENYILPFQERSFTRYFANSLFAGFSTMFLSLFVSSLAGFSLAKYNYFGKNYIFLAILSTMMLPVQVILVPLFLVVRSLGWLDSYAGLIIPQAITAFGIFLMRQHILTIPDDYIDAARIDGSSEFGIYWRVILPMSKSALSALAIFSFLGSWDSFLWPLVVVTKNQMRTLPLGISLFFTEYSSVYNQALAVAIIIMIPMLIVFLLMEKQFVEGIARSGLKA